MPTQLRNAAMVRVTSNSGCLPTLKLTTACLRKSALEIHARHHPLGDRDFRLRHAAIGLGHRTEQGEQRTDKAAGFRGRALALAVAQVVEDEADHRAGHGPGQADR